MPNGFTFEQLRRCADREVGFRTRVYGRKVTRGEMTREAADKEIAMMKTISEILRTQEQAALDFANIEGQREGKARDGTDV